MFVSCDLAMDLMYKMGYLKDLLSITRQRLRDITQRIVYKYFVGICFSKKVDYEDDSGCIKHC